MSRFSQFLKLEIDLFPNVALPIESADAEKVSQFFEEIAVTQKQARMICEKTKNQGQTDFWSKQRTGRLLLNFSSCEKTNKHNILKRTFKLSSPSTRKATRAIYMRA